MECHPLQIDIGNLIDVLFVLTAHHDIRNASPLGSKDLLLDTTYREYLSAKGDFTRHRRVLTHLSLGEGRGDGGGDGDTCRRSVLRCRSFWHVDMDVPVVEDAVVNIQLFGMGLHILQRQNGTLLHHITQVTSQRELRTLALRERSLDEEDLTADTRPGQTCDNACIVVALIDIAIEWGLS